jgi:hypothetical protein
MTGGEVYFLTGATIQSAAGSGRFAITHPSPIAAFSGILRLGRPTGHTASRRPATDATP